MALKNKFTNQVIVITGASGGIGRATAWAFAKQGAKIALLARDEQQLEATKKEVEGYGGHAICIPTDVADAEAIERAAVQTEEAFGPIDVWVNNAMNSVFAPARSVTPEEFKRVTEVTYLGQVYGAMTAMRRMLPRNSGTIIFVGSALAYRGIPLQSAYCGAKHGIQGFFDSLRTELMHEKSKVHISMVQLPGVNTTQFGWVMSKLPNNPKPMGKVYQPEVAARAIVFAAAAKRREVWVGYPVYEAIIGNRLAPWFADWTLSKTGIKGQQTEQPKSPDRKEYLWEPVHEDRGAHGEFGSIATNKSFTLWAAENRDTLRAVAATVFMTIGALWLSGKKNKVRLF